MSVIKIPFWAQILKICFARPAKKLFLTISAFFRNYLLTFRKIVVRLKHKQETRKQKMENFLEILRHASALELEDMLFECEDDDMRELILEALEEAREAEEDRALEMSDYYASII